MLLVVIFLDLKTKSNRNAINRRDINYQTTCSKTSSSLPVVAQSLGNNNNHIKIETNDVQSPVPAAVPLPPPTMQQTRTSRGRTRRETREDVAEVPPNTRDIAHNVIALLPAHEVSLRTFANVVLDNMSCPNARKLLYKAKHWHKLTKKEREHYHKMHAWLLDSQSNIRTLKVKEIKKLKSRISDLPFIDTANVVRQVKELLSAFGVSHRVFERGIRLVAEHRVGFASAAQTLVNGVADRQTYIRKQTFVKEPIGAIKKLLLLRKMDKLADQRAIATTTARDA